MMKTVCGVSLFLLVCSMAGLGADKNWERGDTGVVNGTNVNVRGKAMYASEIVTRLNIGAQVTVLEEVEAESELPNAPERWLKIKMPENTPVWVSALFIDPQSMEVTATRLNVRAGPGENHSIVDRIPMGTKVEKIRQEGDWIEIQQTPGAYAFVAAKLIDPLDSSEPPPPDFEDTPEITETPPQETLEPEEVESQPIESVAIVEEETPFEEVALGANIPEASEAETSIEEPVEPFETEETQVIEVPIPELPRESPGEAVNAPPERIVIREGEVTPTRSIQAPTHYALKSIETGKLINYLYEEGKELKLKALKGQAVRVTGKELIDDRWPRTPVLEIRRIHLLR